MLSIGDRHQGVSFVKRFDIVVATHLKIPSGWSAMLLDTDDRRIALCASGRYRGRETEIGEHRAAHEVERDVEAADVEQAKWIRDKDSEHPEEQQDHTDDLAEHPGVRQASPGRQSRDADHDVDQVVQKADVEESQQLGVGQREGATEEREKAKDADREINHTKDQRGYLHRRSISHLRHPRIMAGASLLRFLSP